MKNEKEIKEALHLEQTYCLKLQQGKLDAQQNGHKNLSGYDYNIGISSAKIQALKWVLEQGAYWKND